MPNSKATRKANLALAAVAPRCRHMKLNGETCAAPAMRGRDFCLFHSANYGYMPARSVPEDASTVQLELTRVIHLLHDHEIEPKTAALILYALQIASSNLQRLRAELPAASASPDDLVAELYRRLDPLPEHAALAYSRLQRLVAEAHRPYDPDTDAGRLDRPADDLDAGAEPEETESDK